MGGGVLQINWGNGDGDGSRKLFSGTIDCVEPLYSNWGERGEMSPLPLELGPL